MLRVAFFEVKVLNNGRHIWSFQGHRFPLATVLSSKNNNSRNQVLSSILYHMSCLGKSVQALAAIGLNF